MTETVKATRGLTFAPWTPSQVAALNAWQTHDYAHPFTCGNDPCRADLVAEENGWRCPKCGYRQMWAHNFMMESRATPNAEGAPDDAALLDWAESHPEAAMDALESWWAQAGRGARELHFAFRTILRAAMKPSVTPTGLPHASKGE